jgi:hypothetical protein
MQRTPVTTGFAGKNKRSEGGCFVLLFRLAELVIYGVAFGATRHIVSVVSLSHSCSDHLCRMAAVEVAPSDRRAGAPNMAAERCPTPRAFGASPTGSTVSQSASPSAHPDASGPAVSVVRTKPVQPAFAEKSLSARVGILGTAIRFPTEHGLKGRNCQIHVGSNSDIQKVLASWQFVIGLQAAVKQQLSATQIVCSLKSGCSGNSPGWVAQVTG